MRSAAVLAVLAALSLGTAGHASPSGGCRGTAGNDGLLGAARNDVLCGLAGNDSIAGMAGNDRLDGRPGNDVVDGGPATRKAARTLCGRVRLPFRPAPGGSRRPA